MVLQTTVQGSTDTKAELAAPAAAPSPDLTVSQGRERKFTAPNRMFATVTANAGSGSLRPPGGSVSAGDSTSTNKKKKTVFVRGNPYMEFDITAGWTDRGYV